MKRERTAVSTDKMQAVSAPPTKIEDDELRLDPQKVIAAWSASADVLRDVAKAVRENQQDNELVRESIQRNRKWLVGAGAVITLLQAVSVALVLRATYSAEGKIGDFYREQTEVSDEVRKEAAETRKEAEALRKEASALTSAVAAVLDASLAKDAQAADVDERIVEAELTVAAAQMQVADTPMKKERAEVKAKEARQRAKDLAVDPKVLEGL